MLSRPIGWISHFQPIVLPSLTLKTANIIHLWIEEDLIYTSVCQAFGFDQSCSFSKGVFGRRQSLSTVNCITQKLTEFLNTKHAFTNFKQLLLKNLLPYSGKYWQVF